MRNLQKSSNYSYFTPRTDTLQYYINDISKFKPLNPKECKDMLKKAKKGDRDAINTLVKTNQRFVLALSKKFSSGNHRLLLDLINEANIGLLKSIEKFDFKKDNVFLTYSVYWMQREIFSYLTFTEPMVKITNKSKTTKVNDIKNKFFLEHGRNPTTEEILTELQTNYGIDINNESDIHQLSTVSMDLASLIDGFDDYSNLYAVSHNQDNEESELIARNQFEKDIENDYDKKLISNSMGTLTEKERKVVELLYGFNQYRSFEVQEVAQQVGVSNEGVRQIEKRALNKIKEEILIKKETI